MFVSEVQPPESASNFHLLPTLEIGFNNTVEFTNHGPLQSAPNISTTEKMNLQTIMKDLQEIENQEKEKKRAAITKNKMIIRGLFPYAPKGERI